MQLPVSCTGALWPRYKKRRVLAAQTLRVIRNLVINLSEKAVLVLRAAQRDFVVPVSIRRSIKPAGRKNGHSWLQLEATLTRSAAPYVAKIFLVDIRENEMSQDT